MAARVTASPSPPARAGMRGYLQGFPGDLARSTARALEWVRSLSDGARSGGGAGTHAAQPRARGLLLAGLGGSAVGGDVARALLRSEAPIPFEVVRDYRLPAWAGSGALLVASSYSGDTEETLAAYAEARSRGLTVWAITSGGELAARAESYGNPLFRLPPGYPPRAALGHSLPPVLLTAALLAGLDVDAHAEGLAAAARRLEEWSLPWSAETGENPARQLASALAPRIPVLYAGAGLYEPAAVRWRAQLAENAKMLSFHHLLPEMDHNEIVGWQENEGLLRHCRAVFLTGSHEHPRVARRIEITAELIGRVAGGIDIVRAPAGSPLEELLGLLLLGDFVSLYAAEVHGVEPVPVERISLLKAALQKEGAA
jgi:glucose/mannose-6-phosphate isomerase